MEDVIMNNMQLFVALGALIASELIGISGAKSNAITQLIINILKAVMKGKK